MDKDGAPPPEDPQVRRRNPPVRRADPARPEAGTGVELAALLRDEIKPYSLYAFFVAFSAGSDLPFAWRASCATWSAPKMLTPCSRT